jgi:hypothetical protein
MGTKNFRARRRRLQSQQKVQNHREKHRQDHKCTDHEDERNMEFWYKPHCFFMRGSLFEGDSDENAPYAFAIGFAAPAPWRARPAPDGEHRKAKP